MFERLWCKLFHIWDDYESAQIIKDIMEEHNKRSKYITMFCPLCQKCRYKIKNKVNYWSELFGI